MCTNANEKATREQMEPAFFFSMCMEELFSRIQLAMSNFPIKTTFLGMPVIKSCGLSVHLPINQTKKLFACPNAGKKRSSGNLIMGRNKE